MMKLIVGTKGTGKTKTMVDAINAVTKTTKGNVVVLEQSMQLTYDVDHAARLIDVEDYKIHGYQAMYGFVAGVLAGNYDITDLFIDGLMKIVDKDVSGLVDFLEAVEAVAGNTNVTLTLSLAPEALPEGAKKYL
ncbi:MAG: hypothetical protein H9882_03005 [Candidatus Fournierella pullistercoris]|uniref:Twitching motility protein PilT n=1 Tax=Candidatus Allofournierella pullistercoris TaxID=2838597 RepID=A0A948T1X9_9FIRM|nr:hypothetical protein [Candidatus Fournierella pullistercoris]